MRRASKCRVSTAALVTSWGVVASSCAQRRMSIVVVSPRQHLAQGGGRPPRARLSGWLMAWARALTAESLANLNTPQHLHRPVTALALPLARGDRKLASGPQGRFGPLHLGSCHTRVGQGHEMKEATMTKGPVVLEKTWACRFGVRRSGGMYLIAHWKLMQRLQELQQAPQGGESGLASRA